MTPSTPPAASPSGSAGSAAGAVAAYLRGLEQTGTVSRAVRRQRGWALREALLFAALRARRDPALPLAPDERAVLDQHTGGVRLADLFTDDFAEQWLTHADATLSGATPVPATQRARITSLRALAAATGHDLPAHREPKPLLRGLLTEPQITTALRALTQRLPGRGPDDHVRLAAILSVMAAWPVRSAALADLRLTQLHDRPGGITLDVAAEGEPAPLLTGLGADRLRAWLDVRSGLVGALLGGPVRTVWVSIRSNSRPGGPRGSAPLPPGMPLRPRGLQRAYARSVEAANAVHHGLPGFPLPRSLDLLRRSVEQSVPRR